MVVVAIFLFVLVGVVRLAAVRRDRVLGAADRVAVLVPVEVEAAGCWSVVPVDVRSAGDLAADCLEALVPADVRAADGLPADFSAVVSGVARCLAVGCLAVGCLAVGCLAVVLGVARRLAVGCLAVVLGVARRLAVGCLAVDFSAADLLAADLLVAGCSAAGRFAVLALVVFDAEVFVPDLGAVPTFLATDFLAGDRFAAADAFDAFDAFDDFDAAFVDFGDFLVEVDVAAARFAVAFFLAAAIRWHLPADVNAGL